MAQDVVLEALKAKKWMSIEEIIEYIKIKKRDIASKSSTYMSIQKLRKKGYKIITKKYNQKNKVKYRLMG